MEGKGGVGEAACRSNGLNREWVDWWGSKRKGSLKEESQVNLNSCCLICKLGKMILSVSQCYEDETKSYMKCPAKAMPVTAFTP